MRCSLLIAALATGCSPRFQDTDPGFPFALDAVTEVGGLAYAGALFYPERQRTDSTRGIVVLDPQRALVDREPVANTRRPPEDGTVNVAVWAVGYDALLGASDGGLLAAGPEAPEAGGANLRLRTYDLTDPWAPVLAGDVALPDTATSWISARSELSPGVFAILAVDVAPGSGPTARTFVVHGEDRLPQIASQADGVGCVATARVGAWIVCAGTADDAPGDDVFVFAATDGGGIGARVGSADLAHLVSPLGATTLAADEIVFVDAGGGTDAPPAIVRVTIGPDGSILAEDRVPLPELDGGVPIAHAALAVPGGLLLGSSAGTLLIDPDTGALLARDDGLAPTYTLLGRTVSGDRVLAVGGAAGLSQARLGDGTVTREGTYYRQWGDRLLTYGTVYEGVY